MANAKDIIDGSIKASFKNFRENGILDKDVINTWLSQSLSNFYSTQNVDYFISDWQNELKENVSSDELLDYISENYVNVSLNQSDTKDEFKSTVKKTADIKGIEEAKQAIKKFITTVDLSGFVDYNDEKMRSYSNQGVMSVMCASLVENIIKDSKFQNVSTSSLQDKDKFYPYEFFVCGNNKTHDITKLVNAMESIRSGKINTVTTQEIEVEK